MFGVQIIFVWVTNEGEDSYKIVNMVNNEAVWEVGM